MNVNFAQLLRFAPFLVPVVIVGLGWALLVRPAASESALVARELEGLRQRLVAVRAQMGAPTPPEPAGDPMKAFERQVAAGDASSRLVEELTRLAAAAGLRPEVIETGEHATVSAAGGPGVAGGVTPDPRFALFQVPLTYSPVMMTVDADYASLGEFLWRLRDLATIVEIRSLEVRTPAEAAADTVAAAPGTVRATLTLFAYARVAEGPAKAGRHVGEAGHYVAAEGPAKAGRYFAERREVAE